MDDTGRPRRAPAPGERRLDPGRSRRALLDAALEEFAAKGYAGARVQDIADRAGVNKQLISYHFGGKQGLYRCIRRRWLEREAAFNDPSTPIDELIVRYLDDALDDPRGTRFMAWQGLTDAFAPGEDDPEDLSDLERRKASGELGEEFDPGAILLLCMAAVAAPIVMPQKVRAIFGLDPASPEFRARYGDQLRRVLRRLAAPGRSARPDDASGRGSVES